MSKVGEPIDLTWELNDLKRRIESLEARILTINTQRLGPGNTYKLDEEAIANIVKNARRLDINV